MESNTSYNVLVLFLKFNLRWQIINPRYLTISFYLQREWICSWWVFTSPDFDIHRSILAHYQKLIVNAKYQDFDSWSKIQKEYLQHRQKPDSLAFLIGYQRWSGITPVISWNLVWQLPHQSAFWLIAIYNVCSHFLQDKINVRKIRLQTLSNIL